MVTEVLEASPDRVTPKCPHFGVCGGCSLQHMAADAQVRLKQETLGKWLRQFGDLQPDRWLPPLSAERWGYRRKARLGVRRVAKKNRTLVGFRERRNSFIADLGRCDVLHPEVGERISDIARLVDSLSVRDRIPQIEVAKGDEHCVLVFRVLTPPTTTDIDAMRTFSETQGLGICLQTGGPETVCPLPGQAVDLHYSLPDFGLRLGFGPTDFTQVNQALNRRLINQAIGLLDPQPTDRVLDLFCGLGNFTLPLARHAASVVGVEGDAGLVERARDNAKANAIANARFLARDLHQEPDSAVGLDELYDKALLDPPRSGAYEILGRLPEAGINRILYVSCSPETLARDAERLVRGLDYRLVAAGVLDMFPHTTHVESMALFERC